MVRGIDAGLTTSMEVHLSWSWPDLGNGRTRLSALLRRGAWVVWVCAALLAGGPRASAEVLLTEKAALARAFPGQAVDRQPLYLNPDQVRAVEKAARSKLPSAVVTVFVARTGEKVTGRAVLDTHIVRTMPESLMTVIEPDGRLRMALVLQFGEPPDYLPREGWLKTFEGKSLDNDLSPGRSVRRVTGSTLTVQALTAAVRRSLAIDRILLRGQP